MAAPDWLTQALTQVSGSEGDKVETLSQLVTNEIEHGSGSATGVQSVVTALLTDLPAVQSALSGKTAPASAPAASEPAPTASTRSSSTSRS
jgi:hypothetical protein